ncbi:sulfatase-like hydrolase/transferase [Seonamhaeicola sp.]|uniref:sulfatase family protein n=1 Tax=Seonamhaeicola sp. TaxID=1912245 RepID=UPI002633185D|nr:sulfatase-like hydrolase/transferase [Seonamhaeicola sp.]
MLFHKLKFIAPFLVCLFSTIFGNTQNKVSTPNIILMMADDLGYGDTGFNGNTIIKTPNLDALAKRGMILNHFYSGNSVCSPTRGTVLTGRHHDRYGIYSANKGHLPAQEITLAKVLKEKGYTTGHFGKWHLGTLNKTTSAKGKSRKPADNFAPPWLRNYDASFVTESAISTWNPSLGKQAKNNPFYENGVALDPNSPSLLGGVSRVVMDRAIPFMEKAINDNKPFLSVVWFHAPHAKVEAGPEYLKMYEGYGEAAHFYGCITELDEQVGRIVSLLEKTGALDNTLIFFCSDNGPEGGSAKGRTAGTTKGLRGRKRSLYDGGVRVPAFAVWPGKIKSETTSDVILSTLDYFPTIQNIVGYDMPDNRPIDGENILPIIIGHKKQRSKSIPFRYFGGISSLIKDNYKLVFPHKELYDLSNDYEEKNNIASQHSKKVIEMQNELLSIFNSIQKSHSGADYNDPSFKPVDSWKALETNKNKLDEKGRLQQLKKTENKRKQKQ